MCTRMRKTALTETPLSQDVPDYSHRSALVKLCLAVLWNCGFFDFRVIASATAQVLEVVILSSHMACIEGGKCGV
jgi:hypothetical protein